MPMMSGESRAPRSAAWFRAAVEAVGAVLWTNNAAGEMRGRQLGWERLTGQSMAEYQGYGWSDAVHPEDAQPTIDAWHEAVRAHAIFAFEHRVCRHDGVWRHFAVRAHPVLEADGSIREWVGTHTDVTEQRQAELALMDNEARLTRLVSARTEELETSKAKLAESEAHFRLLAENVSDMVSRVRADGSRAYVSPASLRIWGVAPDLMLRQNVSYLIHPDDREMVISLQQRLLRGDVSDETLEFRVLHPDRGDVWVESSARSLRDALTGHPDGYVSVIRDITARKTLEDILRHGQRMEAIGKIVAGVAHDFNIILQAVMGGLEVLLESLKEGSDQHDVASLSYRSAKRGSYLTHNLLSYAGKQMLQPMSVDLRPFLLEMGALLSRTLGPNIAVQVSTSPDLASARVDPSQLQTALLNLAVNAQYAMPHGGSVRLEACGSEQDGLITLCVVDTGIGMDDQTLAHATEPFFTTKGVQGTGLGLSMVQGFIAQSGGQMRIASVLGQGTTVQLLLPTAKVAQEPPPTVSSRGACVLGRVLLVDDEPDILITVRAFLETGGYSVAIARSGDEALGLLADDPGFDVLVADYAMPGLSGAALILEVRGFLADLPAVMITGFSQTVVTGLSLKNVTTILKPFSSKEILSAVGAATRGGILHSRHEVAPSSGRSRG